MIPLRSFASIYICAFLVLQRHTVCALASVNNNRPPPFSDQTLKVTFVTGNAMKVR
jgi:hypothetical protein